MNAFYLFIITGVSFLSTTSAFSEPIDVCEDSSYSDSLFLDDNDSLLNDELSFFNDEVDGFDDEILALEEELRKDAELTDLGQPAPSVSAEISDAIADPVAPAASIPKESIAAEDLKAVSEFNSLAEELKVVPEELNFLTEELKIAIEEPKVLPEELKIVDVASIQVHPALIEQPSVLGELALAEKELTSPFDEKLLQAKLDQEAKPLPLDALDDSLIANAESAVESPAVLNITSNAEEIKNDPIEIDIEQAFSGSPVIYTILFFMSLFAFSICLYNLLSLRKAGTISSAFVHNLKNKLNSNHFDDAVSLCTHHNNLFGSMIVSGINARKYGRSVMIEAMNAEGKRASVHFWQKIGLLNDVAIIAPMLGLLGTVLGMFYAFYDLNRSIESISTLFDGLGVSVGTTVAGLIVAILALMLHSIAKYRLVKVLSRVENEAHSFVTLIDDHMTEYKG